MTTPIPVLEDRLRSHYRAVAESLPLVEVSLDDLVSGGPVVRLTDTWTPARRTGRIAMIGLAAAALVAVGLVIASRDAASPPGSVDQPLFPGEVPLLVPGWLPGGFEFRGASDQTMPGSPGYRTAVYATTPGLLTGKLLSVTVTAISFDSWRGGGVETTVDGRRAVDLSGPGVAKLALDNGAMGSITLAGRGFTSAELAAVASGLDAPSIDPADGPVFEQAPAGFSLESDEAAAAEYRVTELTYGARDGERTVSIGVWADAENAFEQYVVLADPGELADVDGKRGYRSTDEGGTVHFAWEEAPGVVVQVSGSGVSPPDVERVAAGLRAVSDGEWRRLLASVSVEPQTGPLAPPTTAGIPATAPCIEQQSSPPVTVVVDCP